MPSRPPRNKETTCLPEDEAPEEHDMTEYDF